MAEGAAQTGEARRGPAPPAPKSEDQPEPQAKEDAEATAKKQERMDKDRAKRRPRGVVMQTVDNALAGAGVLAQEKAAARKKGA